MTQPVEFTVEALHDIEDFLPIARLLTRVAQHGRIACGQADLRVREIELLGKRLLYRVEVDLIVVLAAEPVPVVIH